jgi:IclR family transcriptional regulator, acetate operon repressor
VVQPDTLAAAKPARRGAKETPSIQSLDRGLIILEAAARSGHPVSLSELTELLGIDRSSAFRLANTLKRRGFLANPSGRKDYILGPSIWRLSREYDWSKMLIAVSHEPLKSLASRTMETAHLAVREGRQALFVDHAAVTQMISVSGQTGELVPLYCTAHGKALLADFGKPELEALFGGAPLGAHTRQTIVSIDRLARNCAEIRAEGFSTDDGEYQEGIRCVAAPIRDRDGVVVGSIGISAPLTRFPKERYPECTAQVVETARQISETLAAQAR